ncbi:MAG: radical SAM protein [Candidatus Thermoplasmatota archaeon]
MENIEEMISKAWEIRKKNFEDILYVAVPGQKKYNTLHYSNSKNSFINVSITGKKCLLNCKHCRKKILEHMVPIKEPNALIDFGKKMKEKGCKGFLISGGSDLEGKVPLEKFYNALKELKKIGFEIVVHTGLIDEKNARILKETGIDQVLIDVIGDKETIKNVYNLDKKPIDFMNCLRIMKKVGLSLAPHIVVGLNYGKISGEYEALKFIKKVGVDRIVIVIFTPLIGTEMENVKPPTWKEVVKLCTFARISNPKTPISLGCIRSGRDRKILEKKIIDAGINAIAYPLDGSIDYAESIGLKIIFNEKCCSLV